MLEQDALVRAYTNHYSGQGGAGILPAFEGTRYQDGNGLGDVLRSVFRTLLPILTSGATTFIQRAAEGIGQGKELRSAAQDALAPTVQDLVTKTVNRQRGNGLLLRRRRAAQCRQVGRKKAHKNKLVAHEMRNAKRSVYKRKTGSIKNPSSKKRTKIDLSPINF